MIIMVYFCWNCLVLTFSIQSNTFSASNQLNRVFIRFSFDDIHHQIPLLPIRYQFKWFHRVLIFACIYLRKKNQTNKQHEAEENNSQLWTHTANWMSVVAITWKTSCKVLDYFHPLFEKLEIDFEINTHIIAIYCDWNNLHYNANHNNWLIDVIIMA